VAEELRAEGYVVKGTGDAHGAIDLIALKAGEKPRCVQVKGNLGGPFMNFRPKEREQFLVEAEMAGADAWLAYAPPDRQPTRWLPPFEWPGALEAIKAELDEKWAK
jgi:hypothetical protein